MKCPKCEQNLKWHSDCDFQDFGIEEEGIISLYECENDKCDITDIKIYISTNATL